MRGISFVQADGSFELTYAILANEQNDLNGGLALLPFGALHVCTNSLLHRDDNLGHLIGTLFFQREQLHGI